MKKTYYIAGEFNVTCDICSQNIKAHKAKHRWDGYITCPTCYEQRHPQDFVKAQVDKITIPFSRPIPELLFVDVPYICTVEGRTAIMGFATVGCSIVGST